MVRTTRKKSARTGKHAAGAGRGKEPVEVNEVAEAVLSGERAGVVTQLECRSFRGRPGSLDHWENLTNEAPRAEEPATTENGFSQAVAWMSEPEWNGESSEAMSETSAGSREPECGMH